MKDIPLPMSYALAGLGEKVVAIALACARAHDMVNIEAVAKEVGISRAGAKLLMSKMKNVIIGISGPDGGSKLARPASEITLLDIVGPFARPHRFAAHLDIWAQLDAAVHQKLKATKLSDLL